MKNPLCQLVVLITALICLPIFAGEGEWRQSLDGAWQFSTNATPDQWDTLTVPGNWDTQPAYSAYVGKGWYRREFVVSKDWADKRMRLHFGAVYHDATVTLNGQEIGSHCGGYTPFEFDVTDKLKLGETNLLLVCADNTYHDGAWWPWGGISRGVTLIANRDARIVWQHIRTEPDLRTGKAKLFIRYKLANASASPQPLELASTIDGIADARLTQKVTLAPHSDMELELITSLAKKRVRLWDFDHPNLYTLTTRITTGRTLWHLKSDRFGIRKVEITPDGLLLNGERVRLPGFNRVSDSRATGNTEPDWLVHQDVDLMKSCGAAMSRIMSVPQAPNLLDYLDEKGMLIFEEIPIFWRAPKPGYPLAKQWLTEMIERDYNHPCIIGWSMGNEMPAGRYAYVKWASEFVKQNLDDHRLLSYVSHQAAATNESTETEPIGLSDLALVNFYRSTWFPSRRNSVSGSESEKFTRRIHTVRERWPDKPVFLSECGVTQLADTLQATIPDWETGWAEISENPYVIGASLWTFNDYRSSFVGTVGATGNRTWGVVDDSRKPKAAYEQVRKLFSPVHSLTVAGASVSIVPRSEAEIPSYTLRGYQVRGIARNQSGTSLQTGVVNVPDLKPGSPAWSRLVAVPPLTTELEVNLLTPTGYDVADAKGHL
ncbi:MAG: glycoside hydrolase family 2 TIM barrel-domain containing protein [Verrucomicrobiota bacterium]